MGANSIRNGVASAALRDNHSNHFDATSPRIDLAVVGYGNWGSKHVRVLSGMPWWGWRQTGRKDHDGGREE